MLTITQEEMFIGAKSLIDGIGVKGLKVREMTPGEIKEMGATMGIYVEDEYTGLDVRIHDDDIRTKSIRGFVTIRGFVASYDVMIPVGYMEPPDYDTIDVEASPNIINVLTKIVTHLIDKRVTMFVREYNEPDYPYRD